jgi:pyridoxal phosphate enzyme (YggS family)
MQDSGPLVEFHLLIRLNPFASGSNVCSPIRRTLSTTMSIASNLERLRNEIADACARAHRDPSTVALMAVSKMHPATAVLEAYAAGQRLFGENRVQEFAAKSSALGLSPRSSVPYPRFHLIGPLQNNKTSKAAEIFDAIDTLDSLKTADRLNSAAQAFGKTLPILIEVKLSPEETKHGLAPEGLSALLIGLQPLQNLAVRGLMTVPPFDPNPETARAFFQKLRRLRDQHQPLYPALTELSMGMSNDFAVAIEEGSTTVRLGTAIFDKREYA